MKTNPFAASELAGAVAFLASMSELCVQILQHITHGQVQAVFPLSDQLRQIRADLNELLTEKLASVKDFKPSTTLEARQIEQLRLGVRIVAKYDEVHAGWSSLLADPFTADAPQHSADGWHALLEKKMPPLWSTKKDLLAVVGTPADEFIAAIQDRGFERVLVVLPENASEIATTSQRLLTEAVRSGSFRVAAGVGDARRKYFHLDPPSRYITLDAKTDQDPTFREAVRGELNNLWLMANVNRNTARTFGPRWFNQGLDNLGALASCRHVSELADHFKDRPLILVAPGPSLDRNIHELRRLKGEAIVLAPAQSIKRLHAEGLYPDFIAIIDPNDYTAEPHAFFDSHLIRDHQALVAGVTCHPNVINLPYSKKYVFGSTTNASWVDQIFGDPFVNVGGTSVSVAMVNMALALGSNPIILVGQDLAYSGEKRYAGAPSESEPDSSSAEERPEQRKPRKALRITDPIFTVDGYHGGKVRTMYAYKAALYELEIIAEKQLSHSTAIRLINATEGGANIRGFSNRPLSTVIDELQEEHKHSNNAAGRLAVSDATLSTQRIHRGEISLKNHLSAIARLTELSHLCSDLSSRLKRKTSQRLLSRLGKTEQKLRVCLKPVNFLALAIQEETDQIIKEINDQSTLEDNLDASLKFYTAIQSACAIAKIKIELALRVIGQEKPDQHSLKEVDSGEGSIAHQIALTSGTFSQAGQVQPKILPRHSYGPATPQE